MLTVILILAVVLPNALDAVIVYAVAPCVVVGVPLMAQVVLLIVSPAGSAGAEEQLVTVPVTVGVLVVIAEFCE